MISTPTTPLRDPGADGVAAVTAPDPSSGARLPQTLQRWSGLLIAALGLLSVATAGFLATQAGGPSVGDVAWLAVGTLGVTAAAILLQWAAWPHAARLALATAAMILLVVVDAVSAYSRTSQAAATYPVYVLLVLAWVGFTQPRRTALAFALSAGSALAFVVLLRNDSAIPLSSLVVIVPAGAALGEAVAWVMHELRAADRRDVVRRERLETLAAVLDALPREEHLGEVAARVAEAACSLFDSPAAQVVLVDDAGGTLVAAAGPPWLVSGLDARADLARRLLATSAADAAFAPSGAASEDLASSMPHPQAEVPGRARRNDRRRHGRRPVPGPTAGAVRARDGGLVLTLAGPRRTVGVIALAPPEQPPSGQDPLARLFASQVGTVLEQFETIRALDHAVRHDELTGTGNRRHATELLAGLRPGDGLVLVDIDHFKAVNDRDGHSGGDRLLQALGSYLRTYVRGSDNVARFGGDEFLVVARGVGGDAAAAAQRLLDGWRQLAPTATVSIGVAVHVSGARPEDTLDRADAALYLAKERGRDRVARWGDEDRSA